MVDVETVDLFEARSEGHLSANEMFELGKATLSLAFLTPAAHTSEGDDMLTRAFELGHRSIVMGINLELLKKSGIPFNHK